MAQQPTSHDSRVPMNLGWTALVFGVVCLVAAELIRFGILPKTDYPFGGIGVALVVGGYIACFMVPPLHRRIIALEQRLDAIEKNLTDTQQQ